jgi:hypothetical protein
MAARCELNSSGSRQRAVTGFCQHGNEILGSIQADKFLNNLSDTGARGSVVGLRHYATSRKVAVSNPDEVDYFNLPNPSSSTMTLGSTQPLTEISTKNLPGG